MAPRIASEQLLPPRDVADRLGVSLATLTDWRYRKLGPPYLRLGHRTVRYSEEALNRWLASREEVAPHG